MYKKVTTLPNTETGLFILSGELPVGREGSGGRRGGSTEKMKVPETIENDSVNKKRS